jgi:hypothetical protein
MKGELAHYQVSDRNKRQGDDEPGAEVAHDLDESPQSVAGLQRDRPVAR